MNNQAKEINGKLIEVNHAVLGLKGSKKKKTLKAEIPQSQHNEKLIEVNNGCIQK